MNYFLYYITHLSLLNKKVNTTDAVIFTIEQIILNPASVAKHLGVLTVLEDSYVVIVQKTTAHPNQIRQRATMLE